jgi:hypothetical protein
MTNPLSDLQTDLNTLATPAGVPQPVLTVAGEVLALLAGSFVPAAIATVVSDVYRAIGTTINGDVVVALQGIAGNLGSISNTSNVAVTDVANALNSLQNVLQTAQSLVPGASSSAASALASTSQFATLFGNLLAVPNTTLGDAETTLNTIAAQLGAIATTFTTAANG